MSANATSGGRSEIESQLVTLLERFEERENGIPTQKVSTTAMMTEVRTLDLWRSVIAECLASVFFVFLVCGAFNPWLGKSDDSGADSRMIVSLVTGVSMAFLIHSFGQISGGHMNPAVSVGLALAKRISPLRACMFILAQLGGAIAGAALLYGATSSGYTTNLGATELSASVTLWQGFGVEFLLSLILVFVVFSAYTPLKKNNLMTASPAIVIGLAYMGCTLVGFPLTGASMNPARSLGPAFVMNKWANHWVYWVSPILGGIVASLIYEYIFNPHRISSTRKDSVDGDSSSIASEEEGYDECSKQPHRYNYNALRTQPYDHYRQTNSHPNTSGYPASLYGQASSASVYNGTTYKYEPNYGKDDIYSGSKSLYAKSPSVGRTSLNRSQSVYTRPPPPRSENYYRNLAQSQSSKTPVGFSGTLPHPIQHSEHAFPKNNRQDSLYVTSNTPVVKPEPVYGIPTYTKNQDSVDSSYSTYRGSYNSSRASQNNPPVPAARSRNEANTPNSVMSAQSGFVTPVSAASYHSPNPQY